MTLYDSIKAARKEYTTFFECNVSLSDIVSYYNDNELILGTYDDTVWSHETKVKFIESILLGLPLPSIYVMQNRDLIWNVLDGNQRVATILEFAGVLRCGNDGLCQPLVLSATETLPDLEGAHWDMLPIEFKRTFLHNTKLAFCILSQAEFQSESDLRHFRSALNSHR